MFPFSFLGFNVLHITFMETLGPGFQYVYYSYVTVLL